MKVLTEQPVKFATGGTLAPEDLNRVMLYAQDAVADVAQRRWAKATLTLPFTRTVGDPYTQALAAEELTWRFACPFECVLERAYLSGNLTCTGQLQFSLTTAAGATPTGATTPYLATDGSVTDATVDTADFNVDRVVLSAGVEYKLTVSGTTFSLARADVTLFLAVDRWKSSGSLDVPVFTPTLHLASGSPNATTVNANTTALALQANKFQSARGMTPVFFAVTDLAGGATQTMSLPRWESTRARAVFTYTYAAAVMASSTTGTLSIAVKNSSGVSVGGQTLNVSASTFGSQLINGSLQSLTGSGVSASTTSDYTVSITNNTAVNALKAYVIVWVEWL